MKTRRFKKGRSVFISFLLVAFCMVATINFYYKARILRNKIYNIVADNMLAKEFLS